MRERKYVKFRTDMYGDTKLKIIDKMPKRDLIHYVLNRIIILAGKVNREGDLYMSKNIPYTIETLANEFDRDSEEVKMALDVFMNLEIIEFIDNKIYSVKNFAKHQNIKVKEKSNNKEEVTLKAIDNIYGNQTGAERIEENKAEYGGKSEEDTNALKTIECNEEMLEKNGEDINNYTIDKCDLINKENEIVQHNNSSVIVEMKIKKRTKPKDRKRRTKRDNEDIIEINDEAVENNEEELLRDLDNCDEEDICTWSIGEENKFKEGEKLVAQWGF